MTRHPRSMLVEVDRDCPLWNRTMNFHRRVQPDNTHYRKETQEWLAERFFCEILHDGKLDGKEN